MKQGRPKLLSADQRVKRNVRQLISKEIKDRSPNLSTRQIGTMLRTWRRHDRSLNKFKWTVRLDYVADAELVSGIVQIIATQERIQPIRTHHEGVLYTNEGKNVMIHAWSDVDGSGEVRLSSQSVTGERDERRRRWLVRNIEAACERNAVGTAELDLQGLSLSIHVTGGETGDEHDDAVTARVEEIELPPRACRSEFVPRECNNVKFASDDTLSVVLDALVQIAGVIGYVLGDHAAHEVITVRLGVRGEARVFCFHCDGVVLEKASSEGDDRVIFEWVRRSTSRWADEVFSSIPADALHACDALPSDEEWWSIEKIF